MHKLIDFTDGTLRTPEWLGRQPKGIDAVIVQPKGDSGKDDLSIARGEGRPLRLRSYGAASYLQSVTVVQGYSMSACASGHCGPLRAIVLPRCLGPACR